MQPEFDIRRNPYEIEGSIEVAKNALKCCHLQSESIVEPTWDSQESDNGYDRPMKSVPTTIFTGWKWITLIPGCLIDGIQT